MVSKYYQKILSKKSFEKKQVKSNKIFIKKKKRKSVRIIVIEIKFFQKKKSKRKLSI